MPRLVGGHVSSAGGLTNVIRNAQKIGANCMMFFAGSPRTWAHRHYSDREVCNFLQASKNLPTHFVHALYLVNLATDNPALLKKSIQCLRIDMENAARIQSSGVIVHLGSHQGRGFSKVLNQLITSINYLIEETKDIPFLIENSAGQNSKIGTLDEISKLTSILNNDRVGVCLDTAHLFASGFDLSDTESFIKKLQKFALIGKIKCLHLNDSKAPLGAKRDLHANLGEGHIGLENLSRFINHPALRHLPLILEVPGTGSGPDYKNIAIAKNLTRI